MSDRIPRVSAYLRVAATVDVIHQEIFGCGKRKHKGVVSYGRIASQPSTRDRAGADVDSMHVVLARRDQQIPDDSRRQNRSVDPGRPETAVGIEQGGERKADVVERVEAALEAGSDVGRFNVVVDAV